MAEPEFEPIVPGPSSLHSLQVLDFLNPTALQPPQGDLGVVLMSPKLAVTPQGSHVTSLGLNFLSGKQHIPVSF